MGPTLSRRSCERCARSALVLGFAVFGVSALARDPEPAVAVAEHNSVIPDAGPSCQNGSAEGRQPPVNSWHINGFAPPGRAAPIGATVHPVGDEPSSAHQVALRMQRNLYTRGGRVAPIDVLSAAAEMDASTERTRRAPDWAAQLRAARTERKKEMLMDIDAMLRLVRFQAIPPGLQFFLTSIAAMILLALLDFIGAVFAKEWADTRQPWWFVAGLVTFIGLFAFYATSLKTAELSIVTIGWVVFLQVGLLLYERVRYGASLPPLKWVAIMLILTLQAYLVLIPNETSSSGVVAKSTGEEAESGIVSELQP